MALSAGATADAWEDTVAQYCLGLGLQFGFQVFTSRKASPGSTAHNEGAELEYFPSTAFIATASLTASLRDVSSRTSLTPATGTAPEVGELACAVRDLHGTVFQPYGIWLKATRLRPPSGRPFRPQPDAESLHLELGDLALYWLIYSEAANLRHTPEMVWFIFYCAQRSWQAKQVLNHLRLHRDSLTAMLQQPWLAELGPGLVRTIQALHERFRRPAAAAAAATVGLLQEATLKMAFSKGALDDAVAGEISDLERTARYGTLAGTPLAVSDSRASIRVTVLADGSVSLPYNASSAQGSRKNPNEIESDEDDLDSLAASAIDGRRTDSGAAASSSGSPSDDARVIRDTRQRRRMPSHSPASPNLPLPPPLSINTATTPTCARQGTSGLSGPAGASGASASMGSSAFAAPAAAPAATLAAAAGPAAALPAGGARLTALLSTPLSPLWDPRVPCPDYVELLRRLCPSEAAVAAALGTADAADAAAGAPAADGAKAGPAASAAGSAFLNRVVQPLFLFLSEQVFELGQARRQGLEAAVRIGYDDVSECMAHPEVVRAALGSLPWANMAPSGPQTGAAGRGLLAPMNSAGAAGSVTSTGAGAGAAVGSPASQAGAGRRQPLVMPRAAARDEELYWSRLLALSELPATASARIPWQGDMAHYRQQLLRLMHGSPASAAAADKPPGGPAAASRSNSSALHGHAHGRNPNADASGDGDEEAPALTAEQAAQAAAAVRAVSPEAAAQLVGLRAANAAADWWARNVLRKTFMEHRSVAMPLIAFGRVYQFQLLWFYLLCVWCWTGDDTDVMSWVASAAALHWGTNCLLWTMQAVLSTGATMKKGGAELPFPASKAGKPRYGPAAPDGSFGFPWWLVQIYMLLLCWAALGVGLYIAYIVWPEHDLYGLTCADLLWGRSCYWWIGAGYFALAVAYELLYRQLNFGGYARTSWYQALLRLVPGTGTSAAATSANPLYSPSQHLRTGLKFLLGNAALWAFALAIKFAIDYFILVQPAGPRLAAIMDTDKLAWGFTVSWGWWPEGWTRHFTVDLDPLMAAAQVVVLFLLSLVSSSVSYSVATAILGAMQGVQQAVGAIRHWRHIRAGFHRVQLAMRTKLFTPEEYRNPTPRPPLVVRVLSGCCRAVWRLLTLPVRAVAGLLRALGCLPPAHSDKPRSWEEREVTLGTTAPFWNAMIRSMRGRDLLSDKEAAALSFTAVSLSPASMMATWRRSGGSFERDGTMGRAHAQAQANGTSQGLRETYLPPVAVYVAQIPQLVISGAAATDEQLEVLQEAYLYLLHLLVAVGAIPRSAADAEALGPPGAAPPSPDSACPTPSGPSAASAASPARAAASSPSASASAYCPDLHKDNFHPDRFASMPRSAGSHRRLVARREMLGSVVGLVRALVEAGKAYKDTVDAEGKAPAATRARAVEKLCMALHALARCMTQMHDLPWNVAVIMNRVVVRQHFHQPPVKALLDRGFAALVGRNRNNATAWGAEHMPSYDDFAKVSSWLLAILRPTDEGTAPSNAEAVALLADFCSGLVNPDMPEAPRVDAMRSVSTLIPHYQETVLYALSSADARRVLERAGASALEGSLAEDEVLFKNDEGAPSELLQYLVSEFPDEYRNLLERCRTIAPLAKDEPPYSLEDFLPYGRLHEHRAQLLLWASFRGQVLARTVDGMCMYRTALAMQAVQDAMLGSLGMGRRGPKRPQPDAQGGGDGRLRLSGVQRLMVRGIMRDPSLCVEELVAQLVDVIPGLGPLLERKYGLVVSSQVFAKMAASRTLADRWRAHGISLLATRYEALKVAYLEQDGDALTLFQAPDFTYRIAHQASVLVRAMPLDQELAARRRARSGAASGTASATAATPTSAHAVSGWWGPGPAGSCVDGASVDGGAGVDSEDEEMYGEGYGAGYGGEADAGAGLRLWRRRHQLKHLRAAELQVLFRQALPVNYYDSSASGAGVILGEGKPENQNSAVPYCTGVLLQTIDMNQDNSLAQAFKLRNTTREFEPLGPGPQAQQVAVLGYPEWIFSYRCGLLADLAAATERTFGTQIQRVQANPSAVRAHYGHPDLWNRLFSMTRGGVSKSNAVQHVSEDVFGGYNALKRGGLSKYVSYTSVGKGRDMGLDSILGFEGKISKGCAEQLMSRDVRFLGAHTDFFRCMSLYFTGPGHFIGTWLTMLTIHLGVWVQLFLLLGGVAKNAGALSYAMGAVQILQLGTMPLLGHLFNMWLETGLATALATLARQFIAGGLLFHIFRSTTSAFHLGRAVLFGGASYVATGRGFSLRRKTFTQVYVNYGRSHLTLGADILVMVILILVVGNNGGSATPIPAAAMWSPLLVAAALLAGPFWFTPFFFRLSMVLRDARDFRAWVAGSAARGVSEGWAEWNAKELATLRNDTQTQVPRYRFWATVALVLPRAVLASLSGIVCVTGATFALPDGWGPDIYWVLGGSAAAWALLGLLAATRKRYLSSGLSKAWRWAKGITQVAALLAIGTLVVVCVFVDGRGERFAGVLIVLYANYQIASFFVLAATCWLPKTMTARSACNAAYRHADGALGTALLAVLIIICFIGEIGLIMVDKVQTLVQFNDRFSTTTAARPYAGDDDPAAAAAAGGGAAGGLAAALRRRIPSQFLGLPPPPSHGGGAPSQGGLGGPRGPTSGPPSVLGGWVGPNYRGGGNGTSTPPLVLGSTHISLHSHSPSADMPALPTPTGSVGGASTFLTTAFGPSTNAPTQPPAQSQASQLQRRDVAQGPPAAATPASTSIVVATAINAAAAGGAGGAGGAAAATGGPSPFAGVVAAPMVVQQARRMSSKDLSWTSSGGSAGGAAGSRPTSATAAAAKPASAGGAAASATAAVPPLADSRAAPVSMATPRLLSPPTSVVVAAAAVPAEPTEVRVAPRAQPAPATVASSLVLPAPAWGAVPAAAAAAAAAATAAAAAAAAAEPRSRWATPPLAGAQPMGQGSGGVSPMRSRQALRPASASPATSVDSSAGPTSVLPPIRPSPRIWSAGPSHQQLPAASATAGSSAGRAGSVRGSGGGGGELAVPRVASGAAASLSGRGSGRVSSSGGSDSFAAPPAVTDGALSGWVQPRSMRYSGNGAN
ncbi:hypothetical protein HYH03_004939 [Edaphochlamys debaryana]|uniref:Glycosyl transferase 48 domain-containing protein n=1 Tax=Edaphochlamys debaryana TaxID=47281 RepID=A0A836C2P5_9CHLO|nr:hypothetical protein HYH03_004939 [Edaphochlamys debaryana]|eukprot:KAG2496933.1 hypothetical protein HYH03_004939 [Edaphochlamys debaryana]